MILSLISSLFGLGRDSIRGVHTSAESSVDEGSPLSSPPPALTFTFSGFSTSSDADSGYMTSTTNPRDHSTPSSELSFVTAAQIDSPPLCDMEPSNNGQSRQAIDMNHLQLANSPPQLKKTRYASPEDHRKKRNRYLLPKTNYTPEGLKPRRSIEEISASLGICLLNINAKKSQEQICNDNIKTAKKTNVSFSSYHTVYKVSASEQQSAPENIMGESRQGRSKAAHTSSESTINVASSPHLALGEARTAVGLLLAQKDTKNDITYDSQNRSNSIGLEVASPPRNSLNNMRILPPMKKQGSASNWSGFAPHSSSAPMNTGYRRLHDSHVNKSVNESFCSSAGDESLETKSQDWYNEWYQYEKYKDDQEKSITGQILNESHNTYNSRQALFEKEPSDVAARQTPKDATRAGYDFAPLDGTQDNANQDDDDPFIVNGVNNSWISDISQNTSHIDHQKLSPEVISNKLDSQKDRSGPGWSHAAAKEDKEFPNELNFESKYESKRLEKEHLIAQVVSRLSDNLSLVHDVELMNTGRQGGPTPRSEMDKEGVLTGFSTTSRSNILSALHRTLVTYDPSKSHEEQNLEQYHAMYFIGTLINLTAAKGLKSDDEGRWKPKGWVRDSIVSELVQPTIEDMDVSTLSETSNNYSLGASTISSKHSSPRGQSHKKAGSILSQTISVVSALLQNVSVLLDEYMSTSSPNTLDQLVGAYVHLLGIPRENLTKVTNAFTFSARPSKSNFVHRSQASEEAKPLGERKHVEENEEKGIPPNLAQAPQLINTHARSEDEHDNDDITVLTMESGPSILKADSFDQKKSALEMHKVPNLQSSSEESNAPCDKENDVVIPMEQVEQKLDEILG